MFDRAPTYVALLLAGLLIAACGRDHKPTTRAPPGHRALAPMGAATADAAPTPWSRLNADQRAVLTRTEARVLLPATARLLKAAILTGDKAWYTASIRDGDATITLEGTRQAFDHPEIRKEFPAAPPTRKAPRIGHNELVIEAAFIEDGTSYSLEVECEQPDKNPRCTEDTYVRRLALDLVRVRPAGKTQPAPATKADGALE